MGHASPAAALRYQHAAERRDVAIANGLDTAISGGKSRKRAQFGTEFGTCSSAMHARSAAMRNQLREAEPGQKAS